MLCSTIIPTIGRDSLHAAVKSALQQPISAEHYEIVVANDGGRALTPAIWMESPQVRIVDTHRSERCAARNAGAAIATGRYLNFLDDDDELSPRAIPVLLDAAQSGQVSRVVGAYRCVDKWGVEIASVTPNISVNHFLALLLAGESLPWGASLISSDVFAMIGGFDTSLCVREDYDLECRHAVVGDVAVTPHLVAQFRVGGAGSTDWSRLRDATHYARAKIVSNHTTLARIWPDLMEDPGLAAKIFHGYLTTATWCLGQGRSSDGVSILQGALRIARQHGACSQFWRAILPARTLTVSSLINILFLLSSAQAVDLAPL